MLIEASQALQSQVLTKLLSNHLLLLYTNVTFQEDKHRERLDNIKSRLDHENKRRIEAEGECEGLRHELREWRERDEERDRRISDESKLLYAEAFGSSILGLGNITKSDSEVLKVFFVIFIY